MYLTEIINIKVHEGKEMQEIGKWKERKLNRYHFCK